MLINRHVSISLSKISVKMYLVTVFVIFKAIIIMKEMVEFFDFFMFLADLKEYVKNVS